MIKCIIFLLYILTLSNFIRCDDNIFMTIEELPGPGSNTSVVGPPGPAGPLGLPGPKGTSGRIGTCRCGIERVKELKMLMERLKDNMLGNAQRVTFAFKQDPDSCSVGIKTGRLNDSAMTASSTASESESYAPYRARLDNLHKVFNNGGAWAPIQDLNDNWIQVNLNEPKKITGIITQGYQYYNLWVSSFKIAYSNQTEDRKFIQDGQRDKIFTGNHDRATYKVNMFPQPITARYFRLYVVTFEVESALRMELLTC